MNTMTLLFSQQIFKMFLMLLAGFFAVRLRLIPPSAGKGLTQTVVGVIRPCAILCAFQVGYTSQRMLGLLLAFASAALVHLLLISLSRLLGRGRTALTAVERASIIYTNSGNLLIPLITASMGEEWAVYICAYMGILQVFVWTQGKSLICGEPQIDLRRALTNLNILSLAAGLLLFCLRIQFPPLAGQALASLGDTLGPASMLSIGISCASLKGFRPRLLPRLLAVTAIRLLLCPLLAAAVFWVLRLHVLLPDARQILLITVLGAGAPTGVVVSQIAQIYDRDAEYASLIGIVTMLASIFTLPALLLAYQAFIGL